MKGEVVVWTLSDLGGRGRGGTRNEKRRNGGKFHIFVGGAGECETAS
jgi:hypothetical protein